MSMIFQSYALWPHMTVAENVAYGLELRKLDRDTIKRKLAAILDTTHLGELADRYPGELSGGQQQRVALARALVVEPETLAARRAALESRRQSARGDALRGAPPARRVPLHHGLCHPRPVGSDDDRRRHRGDERRQDRAGGLARGHLRTAALGIRRPLHRLEQRHQGQGARRQPPLVRRRVRCAAAAANLPPAARARSRCASTWCGCRRRSRHDGQRGCREPWCGRSFSARAATIWWRLPDGTQLRVVASAAENIPAGRRGLALSAAGPLPRAERMRPGIRTTEHELQRRRP